MSSLNTLSSEDRERCFNLLTEVGGIHTHLDLFHWLRGGMQQFLPHDILIAAWGDFQRGSVHYDVVSDLHGIRTSLADPGSLVPYMRHLYARWSILQRQPFATDAYVIHKMLAVPTQPATPRVASPAMRSALVHGLCDLRGHQDYLYVILSRDDTHEDANRTGLAMMLPYIDAALRQVPAGSMHRGAGAMEDRSPLPGTFGAPQINVPHTLHLADVGMTEREQQIMQWVEMGKTNHEIGTILDISGFTVKNHLQRIFKKLDVYNRVQAVSRFKSSQYAHG